MGQRRDREIRLGMLENEGLQLAQRLPLRHLVGELRAELRLATRPAEEEDELPGQRIRARFRAASAVPMPPARRSVSIRPLTLANERSATSFMPEEVRIGPPPTPR